MPRTLRQLWADEDHAHERELAYRQRATRLRAQRGGRLRSPIVVHGKNRARQHNTYVSTVVSGRF